MVRGYELSTSKRASIVAMSETGLSMQQIADLNGVCKATVVKTVRNFKERGNLETAARSGRPRSSTATQERYIVRETLKATAVSGTWRHAH